MSHQLIISIDGPTASGKTSLAYGLAARLGTHVLDTGLTYRGVAYAALREPVSPDGRLFDVLRHDLAPPAGARLRSPAVVYHGRDVTDAIWSPEVEQQLRTIAADPAWRRRITDYHRMIISRHRRVIAVGRDCATTITTNAGVHVFLTAAEAVRRERRRAQFRTQPRRAVTVGPATATDHIVREYISRQPRGLILETTFLPRSATLRAVLHHLGDHR